MDFVNLCNEMRWSGVSPSESVLSLIIQCCTSFYVTRLGKALYWEDVKWNVGYDVVLQTWLLDFYAKEGELSSAKRVYNEMPRKDVVANNAMISALS